MAGRECLRDYRLLAWLCSRVPGAPGIVRAVSVRNNLEAQDENR